METERRRILFLHPSSEFYGADRTLLDLVVGLDPKLFDVHVALPGPGPLCSALEQHEIPFHFGSLGVAAMGSLNLRGLLALAVEVPRAYFFVRRLVRRFQPHVVHTNTMVVLGGAVAASRMNAKHVWHIHEIPCRPHWLARFAAHLIHRLSDQVVYNSHATAHTFLRHHRRLFDRSTVIHNGIDAARLEPLPSKKEARRRLNWPQDVTIAMVIGRINAWKGQEVAIDAVAHLTPQFPDLHLAIVGGPPPGQDHFVTSLEERSKQSGLGTRLLRHEFNESVSDFYSACDFLILPSTRPEPFGLVVIEAFCAGKPVLTSYHGGPIETVQPGLVGDWFEPGNSKALAHSISKLLEHPQELSRMGKLAQIRQRDQFSLNAYLDRFSSLYSNPAIQGYREQASQQSAPQVIHCVLGKANPARMNGVNRVVHGLANSQADLSNVQVWGMCAAPDAPTSPRKYGLVLFPRYRKRSKVAPGLLARLDAFAKEPTDEQPVFHLHGAFLPEMASLGKALRKRGLAYVFTPHGAYQPEALKKNRVKKALYRRLKEAGLARGARAIQALSEVERTHLETLFPTTNVVNIAPGQNVEAVNPYAPSAPGKTLQLGSLGRLSSHTKGLDLLLEGLAVFLRSGGQAQLTLAGDGPDRGSLEAQAQSLGIDQHVTWTGELHGPEKQSFFGALDLYVQVSRHEGLPGAPLEAAAYGCPLLISEGTNLGDSVRKHGAGIVLETTNPASIAFALRQVIASSEDVRNQQSAAAQTMISQDFSWESRTRKMHSDLYGLEGPKAAA